MKVNIDNQCPDIKLTYRGYFNNGAPCNHEFDEEVDTGSIKSVNLVVS
jgi:hypothetical protein